MTPLFIFFVGFAATLYHYHRESAFFNFDNIFASSMFFVYIYSWVCSYQYDSLYFALGLIGLPLSTFLFIYCGSIALLEYDSEGKCIERKDNPHYNRIHCLWHFITGYAPMHMAVFISSYPKAREHGFFNLTSVSALGLLCSVSVSLLLNLYEIAPLH